MLFDSARWLRLKGGRASKMLAMRASYSRRTAKSSARDATPYLR